MKNLFSGVLKEMTRAKEFKIFMLFSLYPILYFLSTFFTSSFMNVDTKGGFKVDFLSLLDGMMGVTFMTLLPIIALFVLVSRQFFGELSHHTLFLYKDIDRKQIYWSKLISLALINILFLIVLSVLMFFIYYLRIVNLSYASGLFWDSSKMSHLFSILTILFMNIIYSAVAICLSLYTNTTKTVIIGIGFILLKTVLSSFTATSYFFPSGFSHLFSQGHPVISLVLSTIEFCLYILLFSMISINRFKKAEW